MKNFILIYFFAFVFVFINITNINASDKVKEPKELIVEAHGAILIDEKSGRVLWGKNEEEQLAMASTTKIMTAIVAIENGNMDDIIKISKRATRSPKVKMNLSVDEEIKLEYLMYALMLQSFNDSAVAIAEHIGGSVEDFCKMMTQKAKEIGAYNTSFETPSGLDSENHYSTAHDMAIIAKYALENSEFVKIINTRNLEVKSNKRTYSLMNKNKLLDLMPGAKGVKTGFTGKAGHCFVGAVERESISLISVVLGSGWGNNKKQKWIDTKKILDFGFENFRYMDVIVNKEIDKNIPVERSRNEILNLEFAELLSMPLSNEEFESIEIVLNIPNFVIAPVKNGDIVGVSKIYINNKLEKEIEIIAINDVNRNDLKTSIEKILNSWFDLAGEGSIVLPEF
ncbi:MAG: D-alanyl-D-alanine carboxypeptidase [Defluviitaleaceae bacterium]|nr:D-alanyl-D-alanine carboxypeptidase [Defluviitaleaceae bacterium]